MTKKEIMEKVPRLLKEVSKSIELKIDEKFVVAFGIINKNIYIYWQGDNLKDDVEFYWQFSICATDIDGDLSVVYRKITVNIYQDEVDKNKLIKLINSTERLLWELTSEN